MTAGPATAFASRSTLAGGRRLAAPAYMSEHAAGADLCAALDEELTLLPGARALVPTGIRDRVAAPATKRRFGRAAASRCATASPCSNSPGTIDADYRGPVQCHPGQSRHGTGRRFSRGDRIAQMIVAPVSRALFEEVDESARSERGAGGFGSPASRR